MQTLKTEVLVVGGGAGGTAAAIQAARRGAKTILVSEFPWLGGMLTSAGVAAPDGNELLAFQTGMWGAFLRELQQRQSEGLDNGWVSFFTYDPRIGAQIFADWVAASPNLTWIVGGEPLDVLKTADCITGVQFANLTVEATITLDGTELGDVIAIADVPYRWGWELQSVFDEPSAPASMEPWMSRYPVQVPTWVVVMQEFGDGAIAPEIPPPPNDDPSLFVGAWKNYGGDRFLNYGRLPGNRFMINWPIHGNDYGEGVQRLVGDAAARQQFFQEARWHAQSFARFIQTHLGQRYGLAEDVFPSVPSDSRSTTAFGGGAYALHPYYRESRRIQGLTTVREQDILPTGGWAAPLPIQVSAAGCSAVDVICDAIAIGNYANDHHYPSGDIPLKPKSIRWGGRWTGTPFTIPYRALVPQAIDGLLACEKNISVSHMANGATRLQPLVLGIGQAAGMAAALCIEQNCQPRQLDVRSLQDALLTDAIAPAAVIPLFNLLPTHPQWLYWQQYYLNQPEAYPSNGYCPLSLLQVAVPLASAPSERSPSQTVSGTFQLIDFQAYTITISAPLDLAGQTLTLVTLDPHIDQQFLGLPQAQPITLTGTINRAGSWLRVDSIQAAAAANGGS